MEDENEDPFELDFEEKQERQEDIQEMSDRIESQALRVSKEIVSFTDYDRRTLGMIGVEIILILYGLLIVLRQVQLF